MNTTVRPAASAARSSSLAGSGGRVRRNRARDRGAERLLAHLSGEPDRDMPTPGELDCRVQRPQGLPAARPSTAEHGTTGHGQIGDVRTRRRDAVDAYAGRHQRRQVRVFLEKETEIGVHGRGAGVADQRLRRVVLLAVQIEMTAEGVPVLVQPGQCRAWRLHALEQFVVAEHRDVRAAFHERSGRERRVRAHDVSMSP